MTEVPGWLAKQAVELGEKSSRHALEQVLETSQTPSQAGKLSATPSSEGTGQAPVVLAAKQGSLPNSPTLLATPDTDSAKIASRKKTQISWLQKIKEAFAGPGVS